MKNLILLFLGLLLATTGQAQIAKTVNLTTAGTLSTVLTSDEKSTVTNLSITGPIDARDFKTMRDSMYALTVIDISGVVIFDYTGNKGTQGSSSQSYAYPANTFPAFAFYNGAMGRGKYITSITLPDNIIAIDQCAVWECSNLKSINIPLLTTSIGYQAFDGCTALTNITLPPNLITIGNNVFRKCNSLPSITIPSSVWSIGEGALSCDALINVESDNLNFSSSDGILFNKNNTVLLQCPTSKTGQYIIPSTVNIIGKSAFYLCKLSSVIIPTSVTEILQGAFYWSSLLLSVEIPSSVTSIGTGVFSSCSKLNSVTIPSSVTTIKSLAFYNCSSLESIYIPSSVNSISYDAFAGSITNINVDENNLNYSSIDGVLFAKNKNRLI
jgi:BspA type Leucine rich repeat region (6 copies)